MSDKREKRKNVKPVDEVITEKVNGEDYVIKGIEVSNDVVETQKKPVEVNGVVDNCMNLNIRKESSIDSDVLGILPKDSEVVVLDDTIDGWYQIKAKEIGIGFCMSKFIKIKP